MRMSRVAVGVAVGVALCAVSRVASADGFVGEPGRLWVKAAYRSWFADRTFAGPFDRDTDAGVELGDPVEFDSTTGGEVAMRAGELSAEYVPLDRWVLGFYMPVIQRIRFENRNFRTVTTGTGDVRAHVGYELASQESAATTLRLRTKIPTTEIERKFLSVPLSEGQFDLAVEQVSSWRPVDRIAVTGATLFRYRFPGRFPGTEDTYKPGNEMVVRGSVGGAPVPTLWGTVGYRGLWSTGWELREGSGATRSEFRAYQELTSGLYWSWGRLIGGGLGGFALDASLAWPFTGRDYPRGLTWSLGLAWSGRVTAAQ